ncbi:MAG: FAD-dependent pyridine nucleotide-disulfide oxidoreductase [Ignavibacteriaceae bacterium]|nr:FAD-dependent pyridine nucleotide-disulfide oxidoreductase [Ignavibacteriaceae bacterium]
MKRPVKIIVVGGNAAGPAAAAKAKRYNPNAEVLLFETGEFISTGTCEIPYVLSGEIDDYRKIVFYSPSSFQEEKGVKVFVKHFVQEIDTKKRQIIVKDLTENKILEHNYDRLILATGSIAKSLPGFDTQLKNIFTLKNIYDLIRLDEFIKKYQVTKSIIIGSGYIGLEAAEVLVKMNIQVKVIERENRPLPDAEKEFSDEILKILNQNKVEFIGGVKEVEPVISGDKLIAVRIGDKFMETDFVLISAGFEPDTFLAQSAKLETGKSGAIKVDQYLKTSDRFIYAAGDNVEVVNAVTGKPDYIPLATYAYELGHIAGENAAGGNVKCEPIVKNIAVKIFDSFFTLVGLTSDEARKYGFEFEESFEKVLNLVSVMPGSDYVIGKIVADKSSKRILGAAFLGGREVSGYADLTSALIKLKVTASTLSKINYNYTPPLSPFVNLLSLLGKQFS